MSIRSGCPTQVCNFPKSLMPDPDFKFWFLHINTSWLLLIWMPSGFASPILSNCDPKSINSGWAHINVATLLWLHFWIVEDKKLRTRRARFRWRKKRQMADRWKITNWFGSGNFRKLICSSRLRAIQILDQELKGRIYHKLKPSNHTGKSQFSLWCLLQNWHPCPSTW